MKLTEKLTWVSAQMARTDLQLSSKVVLFALVERSDANLACYPSIRTIMADCGISRASAKRALMELETMRLIARQKRFDPSGDQTSSEFYLLPGGWAQNEPTPAQNEPTGGLKMNPPGAQIEPPILSNPPNEPSQGEPEERKGAPPSPTDAFVDAYNQICHMLPQCSILTKGRRAKIQSRLRERPLESWRTVFERIAASEFLTGTNDRDWRADLDWIIANEGNAVKVLEGKYDHVRQPQQRSFRSSGKMSVTEATQIALDRYREEQRRKGSTHADGRSAEDLRLVDASVSARGES